MTKFTLPLAVAFLSVTFLVTASHANTPTTPQPAPAAAPIVVPAPVPVQKPTNPPPMGMHKHVHDDATMPVKNTQVPNNEVNFANFTKPDTTLADQVIASFNKRDLASFQNTFVKAGYTIITPFDNIVNSEAGLKGFWQEMFGEHGCFKSMDFSGVNGEIQAPYPGVATFNTKLKFRNEGKEMFGLMDITIKYGTDGWKVLSLHLTSADLIKHMTSKETKRMVERELHNHMSKQMGLFLPFVFGLVLGSAIMFAYQKSKKKDHRK